MVEMKFSNEAMATVIFTEKDTNWTYHTDCLIHNIENLLRIHMEKFFLTNNFLPVRTQLHLIIWKQSATQISVKVHLRVESFFQFTL